MLMLRRLTTEILVVLSAFGVYTAGRLVAAGGGTRAAFDHAHAVWGLERRLGIPSELDVQVAAMHSSRVVEAANYYYATVHFPLTGLVLVWLFVRRPSRYRSVRNALLITTVAALAIHLTYPLAPPRMLDHLGFIDTGLRFGPSVYGEHGGESLANQFAAMPSLHAGWAVLVAITAIRLSTSPWRWWWLVHPAATVMAVVVTGNHYWIDVLVGSIISVVALRVTRGAAPA